MPCSQTRPRCGSHEADCRATQLQPLPRQFVSACQSGNGIKVHLLPFDLGISLQARRRLHECQSESASCRSYRCT